MRSHRFPIRTWSSTIVASLLVVTLPCISACSSARSATRSDDPGIVVSDYIFATSDEEREALIAPESRQDWDFETPLPSDEGLALEGTTQEVPVRTDVERDYPFLSGWNEVSRIIEDYEGQVHVEWLIAQPEPETDWLIVDVRVVTGQRWDSDNPR